jgi:hypothetical protein
MAYKRQSGQRDVRTLIVDSTTVLARGDIVRSDESAGDLLVGATNNPVKGIALEASASGNTDEIKYDKLHAGDTVRADLASGELGNAVATDKGKFVDINDKATITRTPANNDARVVDWDGSGNSLDIELLNIETTEA